MKRQSKEKSVCSIHGAAQAIQSFTLTCSECQNIVDGLLPESPATTSMLKLLERKSADLDFKLIRSDSGEFSDEDILKRLRNLKKDHNHHKIKQKEENHQKQMKHVYDLINIIFKSSYDYSTEKYDQLSSDLMKSIMCDSPFKATDPQLVSSPRSSAITSTIHLERDKCLIKSPPPGIAHLPLTKKKLKFCRKGFIGIEEEVSLQKEVLNSIAWFPQLRMTYPYLENINHNVRVLNMLKKKLADLSYENCDNISFPTDYSGLGVEGVLNPCYNYEINSTFDDPYVHHLAKLKEMRRKPLKIIVIGKPGLALYNLAAEIANTCSNTLITPLTVMNNQSERMKEIHKRFSKQLSKGKRIEACDLFQIFYLIMDKLESEEVSLKGYTMAGIPFVRCDLSAEEQLSMIFGSNGVPATWRPDVIVYAVCPSEDVIPVMETYVLEPKRDLMMNMNSLERGEILVMEDKDPELALDETSKAMFMQLQEQRGVSYLLELYIKKPYLIMEEVDVYTQVVLPVLDVYIMEWDPQYMIRVDGRTPVLAMLEVVKSKLLTLGFPKSTSPYPLFVLEDSKVVNDFKTIFSEYNLNILLSEDNLNNINALNPNSVTPAQNVQDETPNKPSTASERLNESTTKTETIEHSLEDKEKFGTDPTNSLVHQTELGIKQPTQVSEESVYKIMLDMSKGNMSFDLLNNLEDEKLLACLKISKPRVENTRLFQSTLGTLCPVKLHEGYFVKGKAEWSVVYLGTIYLLSSEESQKKFLTDPKKFLDPHPLSKSYTFVYGNPNNIFGNDKYVDYLASELNVKVLDFQVLHEIVLFHTVEPQLRKYIKKWKDDKVAKLNSEKMKAVEKEKLEYIKDVKTWQKSIIDLVVDYLETVEKLSQLCHIDDIVPQSLHESNKCVSKGNTCIGNIKQNTKFTSQQVHNSDRIESPDISTSSIFMKEVLEDSITRNSFVEEQSNRSEMLVSSVSKSDDDFSQRSTVSEKVTLQRAHGLIHIGKQVKDHKVMKKSPHFSDLTKHNDNERASISSLKSDLSCDRRSNISTIGKVKESSSSINETFIKEISVDHKRHSKKTKKTDFSSVQQKRKMSSGLLLNIPSMSKKELENGDYRLSDFMPRIQYWSSSYQEYSSIPIFQCIRMEQQAEKLERKLAAAKRLKRGFYPHKREEPCTSDGIAVESILEKRYSSMFIKDTSCFSLTASERSKIASLVESYYGKFETTQMPDKLTCIREETRFPSIGNTQHLLTSSSSLNKTPTESSDSAMQESERDTLMDLNSFRSLSENTTFSQKLHFLERYVCRPNSISKSPKFTELDRTFNGLRKQPQTSPAAVDLRPTRKITPSRTSPSKEQASEEELVMAKISLSDEEPELLKPSSHQLFSVSFPKQKISQDTSQVTLTGEGIDIGYDMLVCAPKDLSLYRARRIIKALGKRNFKRVSHYLDEEIPEQISTGTQTMEPDVLLEQTEIQSFINKTPFFTNEILKEAKKTGVIRQNAPLLNYRFPPNCAYWKKMVDSPVISESKPIPFSLVTSPGLPRPLKSLRRRCKLHSSSSKLVETLPNSDVLKVYNGVGISEGNVESQRIHEFNVTSGKSYIASSFELKYHQIPERDDRNPKPLGKSFKRGVQCSKELLTSNPAVIRKSNQEREALLNEDLKKWAALLLSEAAEEKYYNEVQNGLIQKLLQSSSKWNLRKIINFVERTDDASTQTESTTRNSGQENLKEQEITEVVGETNSFRSCFSEEEIVDVLRISDAMVPPYSVAESLLTHPESEQNPMRSDMMVYNWLNWEQPDAKSLRFQRKGEWYSFQFDQDERDFLFFLNSPLCPKDYRKWQSERFKKEVEIRKKFAFERRAKVNFNKVCDAMLKHYNTMRIVRSINNDPLKEKTFTEEPYKLSRSEAVVIQKRDMIWKKLCRKDKDDESNKQILSLKQSNSNHKTLNLIPNREQLTSMKREEILELLKDIYFEKNQEELSKHVQLQCSSDDTKYLFDTNLQREKNKPKKAVEKNYITFTELDATESNQSAVVVDCKEDAVTQVNFYEEEFNRDLYTESLEEISDLLFKLHCESLLPQMNEKKKPVKLKTQIRLIPQHKPGFELKTLSSDLLLPPNFLTMPFELMHTSRKIKKEWWRYLLCSIVQEFENITKNKCYYSLKVFHSNKSFDGISLQPSTGKTTASEKEEDDKLLDLKDLNNGPEELMNFVESSETYPEESMSFLECSGSYSKKSISKLQEASHNMSSVSSLKNMAFSILNFVLNQIGVKDFSISTFESVPPEVISLGSIMSLIEHLKRGTFRSEKNTKFDSNKEAMIKLHDKEMEKINNIVDAIEMSLTFGEEGYYKTNNFHSKEEKNNLREKIALFNHNSTLDKRPTKDAFVSYYAEETDKINQIVDLIQEYFGEDEENAGDNSLCHSNSNIRDFSEGYEINKIPNLDKMKHCLTKLTIDPNEAYLKHLGEISCSTMENTSEIICSKQFYEDKNEQEDKKRIKEIIRLTDDLLFKCSLQQNPSLSKEKQSLLDFKPKTYAVTQDDLLSFSEDSSSSHQSDGTNSYGSSNNNAPGQVLLTSTDIYNKVKTIIEHHKFQLEDYEISKNEDCFLKSEQGGNRLNKETGTPTVQNLDYYDENKTKEIRLHLKNLIESINLYNWTEERRKSSVTSNNITSGRLSQDIENLAVSILESLSALKLGIRQIDCFGSPLFDEGYILEIESHTDTILEISEECNKEFPRRSTVFFSDEQVRTILKHADAILKAVILYNTGTQDIADEERTSFIAEKTQNIRRHTEAIIEKTISIETDGYANEDVIYLNEEQFLLVKESLDTINDCFDIDGSTLLDVGVQTEVLRKSLIKILQALSPRKEDTTIKPTVVYRQKEAQEIRDHIYNLLQLLSEDEETPQRKNAICYSVEEAHDIKNQLAEIFKTCKVKTPDHKPAFMIGTRYYNRIMCLLKYNKHTYDLDEMKQNNMEDMSDCSSLCECKSINNFVTRSESMTSNNQNKESELMSTSFLITSLDEFELFRNELLEKLDDSSTSCDSTSILSDSTESIRKPCLKNIDKQNLISLVRFNTHCLSKETKKKLESILLAISSSFTSSGSYASLDKFSALKKELDYFMNGSVGDKEKTTSIYSNKTSDKDIDKDNHEGITENNLMNEKESSKTSNTISASKYKEDSKNNSLGSNNGSYKSNDIIMNEKESSITSNTISPSKYKEDSKSSALCSNNASHKSSDITEVEWQELKWLLESVISIEERILRFNECLSIKSSVFEKLTKYEGFAKKIDTYIKLLEDKSEQILDQSVMNGSVGDKTTTSIIYSNKTSDKDMNKDNHEGITENNLNGSVGDKEKTTSICSNKTSGKDITKDNHEGITENNLMNEKEISKTSNTISAGKYKEESKNNALGSNNGSYKSSDIMNKKESSKTSNIISASKYKEDSKNNALGSNNGSYKSNDKMNEKESSKTSNIISANKYKEDSKNNALGSNNGSHKSNDIINKKESSKTSNIISASKYKEDSKNNELGSNNGSHKSNDIVDDNISFESEISNCLKHYKELKKKFERYGMLHFCYDNNRSFREVLSNPDELLDYLPVFLLVRMPPKKFDLYDENHPLVVEGVKKKCYCFLNKLEASDWELSDMQLGKVLGNVLKHFKNESNSFGWIVLNAPAQKSIWEYLESKKLTPNNVIYSKALKLPDYLTKLFCSCGQVSCKSASYEVIQNNEPTDNMFPIYSDEEKKKFADLIRTKVMKKINNYSEDWACLKKLVMKTSCKTRLTRIDVDSNDSEVFVKKLLANISSLKHGRAHPYTNLDRIVYEPLSDLHPILSEYAKDDFQDKNKNRTGKNASMVDNIYGDSYPYCPVALLKYGVFIQGNDKFRAVYKNQVYMFSSSEFMEDFLYYPETYMRTQPFSLPPPRISVLGAIGCFGSRYAKQIATELGTCYLSFDQMFRKHILGETNHPIGVLYESGCFDTNPVLSDLVYTSDTDKSKMEILRAYVNCKVDSNINPPIIFHNLMKRFWDQYPYNIQGFCYYRFPHTMSDLQCLVEKHYQLDTIIFIQSPDNAVFNMVDQVKMNWQLHRAIIKKSLYEQDVREMKTYMKYLKDLFKLNLQNMENAQIESGEEPKKQLFSDTNNIPPGISSLIKTFDLKLEQLRDPSLICKALENAREQQSWYKFNPQSRVTDFTQTLEPKEDLLRVYASETEEINQMKALAKENNILWLEQNVNDFKIDSVIKKIQLLMSLRFAAVNKTQSVSPEKAQMLLDNGIFFLSNFGRQCPVQLAESDVPVQRLQKQYQSICPVIYRSYIYFLSSKKAEVKFCRNPEYYMKRNHYNSLVPMQCAIIGPPKSGKTALANRLAKEFSLQIIDIKGALDYVLTELHFTKTARKIHEHLQKEKLLTDEFAILAIEAALVSPRYMTQGWILDGLPNTKDQFQKLHEKGIIPMKVFSLETTLDKCINNMAEEDLSSICMDEDYLETIFKAYLNSREPDFVDEINNFWGNHCTIPTTSLSYFSYQELEKQLLQSAKDYAKYLSSLRKGKPTPLANVPVTPAEISDYLNPFFGMLCPGCLNYEDLRSFPDVNCPFHFVRKQIIQFKHYCYWICPKHVDAAMSEPTFCFKEDIDIKGQTCKRICLNVNSLEEFFDALEYRGFCIVCYHNGIPLRVLNKGCKENVVDYQNNFYSLCSDQCFQKFTTKPNFYTKINIEEWEFTPTQLTSSFKVKDLSISLSKKLYLEQNLMPAVKQALPGLVHNLPYIPGLSSQQAGCTFLGYSLKCFSQNIAQRDVFRSSFRQLLQDLYDLKTVIDTVKIMPNPYHTKQDIKANQIFCETDEDKNTYLKGLLVLLNNKKNSFIGLISQVLYFSKLIVTKEAGHEYATKWFILLNKIPNTFTDFLHSAEKVINHFSQKELGSITVEVRNEYLRSLFCSSLLSNFNEDYAKLSNDLTDFKNLLTLEEKETILLRLNPFLNFIKDIKKHSESKLILTEPYNEIHCKISAFSSNSKINTRIEEDKLLPYNFKEKECELFNNKDIKKYIDDLQFSRIHYHYDPYSQIHKTEPCCSKPFGEYLEYVVFPNNKMQPVEHTAYRLNDFINENVRTTTNLEIPLKKFQKMYHKYYRHYVKLLIENYVSKLSQERVTAVLDLEHENNIKTLDSKLKSVIGNKNKIHLKLFKKLEIKEPIRTEVKHHDKALRKKNICSEETPTQFPEASSFFKELVTNYSFDTVVKVIQNRFPNTTQQQILKSITNVFPGFLLPSSKLSRSIIVQEPKQINIRPVKSENSSSASEKCKTYPWPGFDHSVKSDILRRLSTSKRRISYSKQMRGSGKI